MTSVWEVPLPKKGKYQVRFDIACGRSIDAAKLLTTGSRSTSRDRNIIRKVTLILPENISKSYRRICQRTFSGVNENHHDAETFETNGNTALYKVAIRLNETLDAIKSEQILLWLNYISIGYYPYQFYISQIAYGA